MTRLLSLLLALLASTSTYCSSARAELSARFLEVMQKEIDNRATARHAIASILEFKQDEASAGFWASYLELERHNATVYASQLAPLELRPTTVSPRLKGFFASVYYRWAPRKMLASMAGATRDYYMQLHSASAEVPVQYKAFYQYVLAQEQAQVEAFALAAAGRTDAAKAVLDAFLKTSQL